MKKKKDNIIVKFCEEEIKSGGINTRSGLIDNFGISVQMWDKEIFPYLKKKFRVRTIKDKLFIVKHKEREDGWTGQKAKCDYALWWDCGFLCTNKKINPKNKLVPCKFNYPNFEKCNLK